MRNRSFVFRTFGEHRNAPPAGQSAARHAATTSSICGFLALTAACADEAPSAAPAVIDLPPADLTLQGHDFSRVLSVVELEDGRVLVTDQIENSISVVDLQSGEVRTEGSTGEGPGEYGRVGHLYPLGGDSTLFVGEPPRPLLLAGDRIVQGLDPVYPRLGMGWHRGAALGGRSVRARSRDRGFRLPATVGVVAHACGFAAHPAFHRIHLRRRNERAGYNRPSRWAGPMGNRTGFDGRADGRAGGHDEFDADQPSRE